MPGSIFCISDKGISDSATREDSAGTSSNADVVPQSTKSPAPVAPDPSTVAESHDDIDFDSIGLSDEEMEELLGETKRDDGSTGGGG